MCGVPDCSNCYPGNDYEVDIRLAEEEAAIEHAEEKRDEERND
jgi:hypothetical protein